MFAGVLAGTLALSSVPDPSFQEILGAEHARTLSGSRLLLYLDQGPKVASRAALAIGRTKDPAGREPLRAHLAHPDAGVRAMVAFALGLLSDPDALQTLLRLARQDPSSAVRYSAVDAVGRILAAAPATGTSEMAADVLIVVRADVDPAVRGHASAALEVFRDRPFAVQLARDIGRAYDRERDPTVRWHLMWTVFRGFARVVDPIVLLRGEQDTDEFVRAAAVRGLARRPATERISTAGVPGRAKRDYATPVSAVEAMLDDRSWHVQLDAREALRHLRGQPATEHLTALPPGLHLPPLDPRVGAGSHAFVRSPDAGGKPSAPIIGDVRPVMLDALDRADRLNGSLPGSHPRVRIATTKGTFVVRLYPEWAPFTVANFLNLANKGYFDGLRWFRIVPDFVVQTGDPKNTGEGDAGYSIGAEENPIEQRAGVISMGLNYDKGHALRDSAGTQFYITLSPQLHLDRDFTVFGEIEAGFSVLAHLTESDRMLHVEQIDDR